METSSSALSAIRLNTNTERHPRQETASPRQSTASVSDSTLELQVTNECIAFSDPLAPDLGVRPLDLKDRVENNLPSPVPRTKPLSQLGGYVDRLRNYLSPAPLGKDDQHTHAFFPFGSIHSTRLTANPAAPIGGRLSGAIVALPSSPRR